MAVDYRANSNHLLYVMLDSSIYSDSKICTFGTFGTPLLLLVRKNPVRCQLHFFKQSAPSHPLIDIDFLSSCQSVSLNSVLLIKSTPYQNGLRNAFR
jgi:hypothetical protein